jgi:outer membrane protein assembly factor BamB
VTEITRAHKIAWQYQAELQKGGGTYACQRLANGNTLVGENSTGRVLEVDGAGKVVFALNTTPCQPGDHQNMRMARKLASGNYLVCHSGAQLVKEYTPKGEVVWEVKAPGALAFAAIRTANDTTLVSSLDQITEFDRAGKKVWQFTTRDPEGVKIRNMTGLHLQRDGSLVIGCYQAYDQGEGSALFMINRDKQILWRYANPKADGTMMAVQLLSPEGRSAPGPCQR